MIDPSSPLSWMGFILLLAIGLIVSALGRDSGVWYGPFIGSGYLLMMSAFLWPLYFAQYPRLVYFSIFDGVAAAFLLLAWGMHYMGVKI